MEGVRGASDISTFRCFVAERPAGTGEASGAENDGAAVRQSRDAMGERRPEKNRRGEKLP